MKAAEKVRIIDDVWKAAEDLIIVAEQLEEMHAKKDGERLRNIVGRIENWCVSFKGTGVNA